MFASADTLQASVLAALAEADSGLDPLDATVRAFTQAAAPIEDYLELARARRSLIDSSPELRERDLLKMAQMAAAVADALARRGIPRRDATFVSQAATTVFTIAVDGWARAPERGLAAFIQDALNDLRAALGTGNREPGSPGHQPEGASVPGTGASSGASRAPGRRA
jgi:hypothetical protein